MPVISFRKDEILRKKKLIDRLFAEGSSFFVYPFKIYYLPSLLETQFPVQILISVGKRAFRHAVDRNRIRRQIKEVYRQNKHVIYDHLAGQNRQCILAILYTANVRMPKDELDLKIKAIIKRLNKEIDKNLNNHSFSLSD